MRLLRLQLLLSAAATKTAAATAVTISNVVPRRDSAGEIINAHAGGIYNFRYGPLSATHLA